jgi:hypothetical protein
MAARDFQSYNPKNGSHHLGAAPESPDNYLPGQEQAVIE